MDCSLLVKHEKKGNVLILHLEGRLDALSTPEAEKIMLQYISEGNHLLLLDFSSVEYITSAGMRMLLSISKKLKSLTGSMALFGVPANVLDVLTLSGFDHMLSIYETEKEAISHLQG
jgi:anti-anti-sigma factor